jgi:hypothetical protein
VCDADCVFTLVDIGGAGRQLDSGLFATSEIKRFLESPQANLPPPFPLPLLPPRICQYHLIADGGFGLNDYTLTPFPLRSADTPEKCYYNRRLTRYFRAYRKAQPLCWTHFRDFTKNPSKNSSPIFRKIDFTSHKKLSKIFHFPDRFIASWRESKFG